MVLVPAKLACRVCLGKSGFGGTLVKWGKLEGEDLEGNTGPREGYELLAR